MDKMASLILEQENYRYCVYRVLYSTDSKGIGTFHVNVIIEPYGEDQRRLLFSLKWDDQNRKNMKFVIVHWEEQRFFQYCFIRCKVL